MNMATARPRRNTAIRSGTRPSVPRWRVDSHIGDFRPWAQISYNQQFGENVWKSQSGLSRLTAANQYGNWLDVSVGADMLLNQHFAAYASMSQSENHSPGRIISTAWASAPVFKDHLIQSDHN